MFSLDVRGEVVGVVEENEEGQALLRQALAVLERDLADKRAAVSGAAHTHLQLSRAQCKNAS